MKTQNLFLALGLLVLPTLVQAQFTFTTNNGAITITGYNTAAGLNVVIPAATNGYPVTTIGNEAFYSSAMTNVTIPSSVTNIVQIAFYQCSSLKKITIPSSVIGIGVEAFDACSSLTNITVAGGDPAYSSLAGVLFDAAQATLIQFPGGQAGSYTVPGTVTAIGQYSFYQCLNLTNVTISDSVTSIGIYAFAYCFSLTNVTFGNHVATIGQNAFWVCHSLINLNIPGNVTTIGNEAFDSCSGLTNVTFGDGVGFIGVDAFDGCSGLKSVTIPDSVTSIGESAFIGCINLTNFTVTSLNPNYSSLGGVLFDKAQANLVEYPGGLGGPYTVPSTVTGIEPYAAYDCPNLTSVIFPNSVGYIGEAAFGDCLALTNVTLGTSVANIQLYAFSETALTSVTIPRSVTYLGYSAFSECSSLRSAYFQGNAPPDEGDAFLSDPAIAYYLFGTMGWGSTYGTAPTKLWNPQANTFNFIGGHFGFNLTGPTNLVIVVEACTNLTTPVWLPVATNTFSSIGTSTFSDLQSGGYPIRFYRERSP